MTLKNKGFTLIEISIVIVVIGLIAGIVVVGQSMVNSARLQSVIADVDVYKKAAQLFKDKYKELPGDFSGATGIWGTDPSGCPATSNITPKTTTCSGNGDGFIGDTTGTPLAIGTPNESMRVWQHLANAELIQGRYTGAASSNTTFSNLLEPGLSAPKSSIKKATYGLYYINSSSLPAAVFPATYNHVIIFGISAGSTTRPPNAAAIRPLDAMSMDQKIDDGKPATGTLMVYTTDVVSPSPTTTCATSTSAATAGYSTSTSSTGCSLIFITGF